MRSAVTVQILKFLETFPALAVETVGSFLPMKNELAPVPTELLAALPLRLSYPVQKPDGSMAFAVPDGETGGHTWLRPPYRETTPGWYLVPGLGFDFSGARLGRGKGFYDQYLRHNVGIKVGVAWSGQILENVPVESHDCHMDYIITENFCWDVRRQRRLEKE